MHRQSVAKRLANGSFVLSCTRRFSLRVVRFFEKGFAAPLFASVKTVDSFMTGKITDPINKSVGVRKNFAMPARNAISSFVSNNSLFKKFSAFRTAFLKTSIRAVGLFLLTFGLYSIASFLLNRFVTTAIGTSSISEFSFAAITIIVGFILTAFGDKNIISSFGTGRITGTLLLDYLGVNRSVFERYPSEPSGSAVGISIIAGSLAGVATLFFRPSKVLLFIVASIIVITILHVPEFGLLLAVFSFSFVPVECSAVLVCAAFVSFLLKCIRLKRNFRFGTADLAVLALCFVMFIRFAISDGTISGGEGYLLCFTLVYFLAKNLLCSENLVFQAFRSLCFGLSVGMALYILGEYGSFIPHVQLKSASEWLTKNALDADMLFMLAAITLPFAFFSFASFDGKRPKTWFVIFALICAVITDSFLPFVLMLTTLFVFIACASKAPVGAALGAAITLPPLLVLISGLTSSSTVSLGNSTLLDSVFGSEMSFKSFWTAFANLNGIIATVLFSAAFLLIFQRICGCAVINRSRRTVNICGTLLASVLMIFVCTFIFNPFSDLRVFALTWFVLGLCGAAYNVCIVQQDVDWEV